MGVNNYFLLTQTISRLILGTGEATSIFIHSLLKLCVIKMTLDAYTCLRMFWIYKNHSSLINHHLRNVNRSSPPGFQENNWPYLCLLGARCKTPSLQHGPWWPPRKQTKKKPKQKATEKLLPLSDFGSRMYLTSVPAITALTFPPIRLTYLWSVFGDLPECHW